MTANPGFFIRVAGPNGEAVNGGKGKMPIDGTWSDVVVDPVPCERGWHVTDRPDLYGGAIEGFRLWVVEVGGKVVAQGDKAAVGKVRCLGELTPEWPLLSMRPYVLAVLAVRWRREHPSARWPNWANLSGAHLSVARLSGAKLSWADLYRAHLSGADLGG